MNKKAYHHLLQTYGRRPGVWFGVFAGLMRPFLLIVVSPLLSSQLATNLVAGNIAAAQQSVWLLFWANLGGAVIGAAGELVAAKADSQECRDLTVNFYRKLINKDLAFYRDHQAGYLTGLLRQYADSSLLLVRMARGEMARALIAFVVPVAVLLVVNWQIGLVALGVILVQFGYIMWASSKAHKYRKQSHEIYRKLTGEVSDEITNIIAFKSSGMEKANQAKVAALAEQENQMFVLRRKTTTLLDLPRGLITACGMLVAFYIVIANSSGSAEAVGLMVLTLMYLLSIIRNVNDLPNILTHHDDLITKMYPTLQYLEDIHETIKDPPNAQKLHISQGAINIKDVAFSYPSRSGAGKDSEVFKRLNIEIKPQEHIGIVGLSGAGKSTLASLLMRFDEVKQGVICIDGIDIRRVRQSDLRAAIAYVPQEPLLFHRTIRENIAYFSPEANDAAIKRAAKAAHAHEFIERLPDGYDTMVGERGVKLSGGQKQRVVIARSILKNAPIMLFDEATSALDSESERIIQEALPGIIGKHTAIVIAHRLSTVAGMDRILVMHQGQVVEEGSHAALLRKKGRYYSLWQKQAYRD